MTSRLTTLFVIDDDVEVATLISVIGQRAGFKVATICDPSKVLSVLHDHVPNAIVLDLQMPGLDGIQVLRELADRQSRAVILLVSGMEERIRAAAETFGSERGLRVLGSVQKPFDPEALLEQLQSMYFATTPLTPADLRKALDDEQLLLVYQPIVRRAGPGRWQVNSVEALLRWNHPDRGLLSPGAFLAMGERSGLSGQMTDFVIRRALTQLKDWRANRIDLGLRVNISASLLTDVAFPDRFESLAAELEVDPSTVTLEVTETAMLDQHPTIFDILTRFRLKRVNLAIDDFGIGYSSLTQLFRMPFNEMKIDKSLIEQVARSAEAKIMVEALVDLAHKLNLTVCAEGVESQEVLDYLSDIRVDSAQGFFISRPVRPEEITDRFDQESRENAAAKLS